MTGFLLDGNLPARLRFSPGLPLVPLSSVGQNPTDSQIWDFAKKRDLVIVSKDADFSDRIIANSPPPRVVHLRFGNLRRNDFHALLARVWPQVETLLETHKLVNVYADRLEGIG
jgi:predicted nuclease of predicted toxin-antitoxin system